MSAMSLTFWFIILNCVMQARQPRAFPLLHSFHAQMKNCFSDIYLVWQGHITFNERVRFFQNIFSF